MGARAVDLEIFLADPWVGGEAAGLTRETVRVRAARWEDGPSSDRVELVWPDGAAPLPFPAPGPAPDDEGEARRRALGESVLGTVHRALRCFEDPFVLGPGRALRFPLGRLRVGPDEGVRANAHYSRGWGGLAFFRAPLPSGDPLYTAASHDIVCHELGHALLDSLAPDLYTALDPWSLAVHEAIADLTAFVVAFESPTLRAQLAGAARLRDVAPLQQLGEAFARALQGQPYLRSLDNRVHDNAAGEPPFDDPRDRVAGRSPHADSLLLSGALFEFACWLQDETGLPRDPLAAPVLDEATWRAVARQFRKFVFRGLDALPPGELDLVDVARALVAHDRMAHDQHRGTPRHEVERQVLARVLARRGALDAGEDLLPVEEGLPTMSAGALTAIAEDPVEAERWWREHAAGLGPPPGVALDGVRVSRLRKLYRTPTPGRPGGHPWRVVTREELVLKAVWRRIEPNPSLLGLDPRREVRAGAVLCLDARTGRPHYALPARVSAAAAARRDARVRRLYDEGRMFAFLEHQAAADRPPDGSAAALARSLDGCGLT